MNIDITINDERWHSCGFDVNTALTVVARHIYDIIDIPDYATELSVVLCDDIFIQRLNKEYRGKDKPTNVLSFPQLGDDAMDSSSPEMAMESSLGDIIVSYDTIAHEAEDQQKTLEDHFKHMCVHGMLHLLGYDHIDNDEAEEMESLEVEILSLMGIKNPYSETEIMA